MNTVSKASREDDDASQDCNERIDEADEKRSLTHLRAIGQIGAVNEQSADTHRDAEERLSHSRKYDFTRDAAEVGMKQELKAIDSTWKQQRIDAKHQHQCTHNGHKDVGPALNALLHSSHENQHIE